ncbi:MAG: DNA-directed RNA polymerase subunit D [Halobacteriales archaeon]
MSESADAGYDVTFVERDERRAVFVVRDISPAFANGIRRAILADVPTMAIDTVRVIENTSVMFDEMIALRLGLVPLNTPPDEFEVGDEVTLGLDVTGEATVYSGDLVSADSQVVPVDENIPIIDLKEGQRLEVEADAVYQPGSEHVKHQGGVAVGYTHLRRVEVVGDLGEFEEPAPVIVRGAIEEDGELVPTEAFDNDLRNRYPDEEIEVVAVPGAFVFHVESDGSMSVDELVVAAASTLGDRARELEEALQL